MLLIVVAACGSGTDSGSDLSNGGGSEPVWVGQVLDGELGADQPTPIAVDGDQVVVAIVSEDGVITGFATDERGQFSAGTPAVSGHQYLSLGGITRLGDGWVAVGSGGLRDGEELLFELRAFRSDDGRTWSEVDATGLDGPADVTGLTTVDDSVVAVGTLRTSTKPAQGGFRPVAWHSADGQRWTTVALPTGGGTEGSVQAVVVTGDEVLADIELCRQDSAVALYVSDDGNRWSRVDTSGIGDSEEGEVDAMTATDDGRIIAFRRVEAGLGTWTWPAATPLPTEDEPVDPTSEHAHDRGPADTTRYVVSTGAGTARTPTRSTRPARPATTSGGLPWPEI